MAGVPARRIVPVVLCGGSGTGMWPLSRAARPKQLLALSGERTLLQETLGWLEGLPAAPPVVVCGQEVRFAVAGQLEEVGLSSATVLVEPGPRGTAPALAVAAAHVAAEGDDPLLLVLPSDQRLSDIPAFQAAVLTGAACAEAGWLVTFGVTPTEPATRYGYLRRGEALGGGVVAVERFLEKPDATTAARLFAEGRCWWNAGTFLFTASAFQEALERHASELAVAAAEAAAEVTVGHGFHRLGPAFAACPEGGVEREVMEHADRVAAVPLRAGWRDLGSWDALWQEGRRDDAGNSTVGDVLLHDVRGSYLRAGHRLVVAVGLSDTVVVETADAVLVATRDRVEEVREVVARMRGDARVEVDLHTVVERPWGAWELLDTGPEHRVKRLVVRPGGALSLQLHHNRREHWVVVRGIARVTVGDATHDLGPGASIDIPEHTPHRLENLGEVSVELVEVALGRADEADIVRLEDRYGREGE